MLASLMMVAALVVGVQQDREEWEYVSAKDGKFSVELPAVEDQTGSGPIVGPSGPGMLFETLRQTGGLIYVVARIEMRAAIPKAAEAQWLDYTQEKAATRFGSGQKTIAEKRIQVGGTAGREFTIQVKRRGSGTQHMRGRSFVKGTLVYTVVAISASPGEPLPAKANRFLESFSFGPPPQGAVVANGNGGSGRTPSGWKTVKTANGKATVAMPRQPNGEQSGSQNDYTIEARSYQIPSAEYVLLTVEATDPFAGTPREAEVVKFARDEATKIYGSKGKVKAEKPVNADGVPGREWTMTLERYNVGPVQARARTFVVGKFVYVVAVGTIVKNKDLPADTERFLDSFAFRDRPATELAQAEAPALAPVPAPEAMAPGGPGPMAGRLPAVDGRAILGLVKFLGPRNKAMLVVEGLRLVASISPTPRAANAATITQPPEIVASAPTVKATLKAAKPEPNPWGREVDPDGDVPLTQSGQVLTMRIPGSAHLLAPERGKMNAPRVVASTRGDFDVTVRVDGAFRPARESTVKGLGVRQAAGLILWKDAENYLVFQHRAAFDDGQVTHQAVLEELAAGGKGVTHRQPAQEGPVYLRLERQRGRISASFSADGRQWKDLKPVATTWADGEIEVGVIGVNTSTSVHEVTFDNYALKPK